VSVRNQILSIKLVHSINIENISLFVLLSDIFTDSDEKSKGEQCTLLNYILVKS